MTPANGLESGLHSDLDRRVLRAMPDAVVVVDLDGRIEAWEGAAERLLHRTAADVRGRTAAEVLPSVLASEVGAFVAAGTAERADLVLSLGPGGTAAATLTPLRDSDAAVVGAAVLIRPMGAWLDPWEVPRRRPARAGLPRADGRLRQQGASSSPADSAAPPRRRWHRTLGGIVRDLIELAGRDLAAMDSTEELARLLVGQARRLLPSAECMLSIVPRDQPENFRIVAGAGPWAERLVGREWPHEGTQAGVAMTERRTVETVRLAQLSALSGVLAEGNISTARLVPLLSQRPLPDGRVTLGVLGFYRSTPTYFTPYERRLIDEFVRVVGVSLQRTELRRSTADTAARLQTGVEVAMDLARSLEAQEVIRRLVQRTVAAVAAQRATLLMLEEGDVLVVDGYDSSGHPELAGRRFPLSAVVSDGEPVLELAARDGKPRISGPYHYVGLEAAQQVGLEGLRHTLTLPLVLGGSTMGLLVVSRRQDRPFSREDALTLQLVGSVAALMLRNARLFEEAQEANRTRSDFLNMAAHELRTPLTVIKGYLSMLSDGSLGEPPPRWEQTVHLLARKSDELVRLVDDLLLTSRLESGGLPVRSARIDLSQAIEAAARRAEPRVTLLQGRLELNLPPGPVEVEADPDHVSRVLDNLINNALTYRRPGEPAWVRLEAAVEAESAVVAVEDNGRGVPSDMRERIFERFIRVEDGSDRPAGTGLGLYISRQLAERHRGRVELERTVSGVGSRFVLRLPVASDR